MAPGPLVATQTPTSPLNLAYPQAANAAISSWLVWMKAGVLSAFSQAVSSPLMPSTGVSEDLFHPPGPEPLQDLVGDRRGHQRLAFTATTGHGESSSTACAVLR